MASEADFWQAFGAIGTMIAALAAAAAAGFAGWSLRGDKNARDNDAKATDVSSYLDILSRFQDSERKIEKADAESKTYAINEHFNFAEGMALLCNKNMFGSATAKLCSDTLINHLAIFENNDYARDLLQASVTAEDTYEDLKKFYNRNKSEIVARAEARRGMAD